MQDFDFLYIHTSKASEYFSITTKGACILIKKPFFLDKSKVNISMQRQLSFLTAPPHLAVHYLIRGGSA